jgi:hypothetical protein
VPLPLTLQAACVFKGKSMKIKSIILGFLVGFSLLIDTPGGRASEIPTTKSDCRSEGMVWRSKTKVCVERHQNTFLTMPNQVRNVLGFIGAGCAVLCLILLLVDQRPDTDPNS